ncbi:MAG: hypothetical protein WC863_01065 [Patescibacteria group bacterium]
MPLSFGRKLTFLLAVFILSGGFLLVFPAQNALAYHSPSSYQKLYNDTLTSDNWNELLFSTSTQPAGTGDFVNTWLPAFMNGPLGVGMSTFSNAGVSLDVVGKIKTDDLFSTGNIGIGTTIPSARLEVAALSGYSILGGSQKIGNVASPTASSDVATLGWVNSAISSATGSITLWGGTTGGNIWNLNSGNIGIGTTAPGSYKLNVQGGDVNFGGAILVAGAYAYFGNPASGAYSNFVGNNAPGKTSFAIRGATSQTANIFKITDATGTAAYLDVNASGNVGIGTASPQSKLHVSEDSGTGGSIQVTRVGQYSSILYGSDLNFDRASTAYITASNAAGALSLRTGGYNNRLTILSGGNIGIGTANPAKLLNLYASSTSPTELLIENSGSNGFTSASIILKGNGPSISSEGIYNWSPTYSSGSGWYFGRPYGGDGFSVNYQTGVFNANTANVSRSLFYITSAGNVGVGTTTPAAKLEVAAITGYSILGGSQKIGNVASPTANSDVATLGWVNSAISSATGSITLWGGTTGGNIWSLNSGNVGIGITNPTAKLELEVNVGNGNSYDILKFSGNSGDYGGLWLKSEWNSGQQSRIGFYGTSSTYRGIGFATNGATTPNVYINESGNVGIGTTTPAYKLEVLGTLNLPTNNAIRFDSTNNNAPWYIRNSGTGMSTLSFGIGAIQNSNDKIVFSSSGYLGVGTSTPVAKLNVDNGDISVTNSAAAGATREISVSQVNAGGGWATAIGAAPGVSYLRSIQGDPLQLRSGTTTLMYLMGNGNIGIGTTAPAAKLEVAASSGYSILGGNQKIGNVASPTANSDVATLGWVNSAISSATGSITLWGGTTGGNIWSLNSGNVGIGTSAPGYKLDMQNVAINGQTLLNLETVGENSARLLRLAGTAQAGINFTNTEVNRDDYELYNNYGTFQLYNTTDSRVDIQVTSGGNVLLSQSAGNVGIGTTTPATNLHVQGRGNVEGNGVGILNRADIPGLMLLDDSTEYGALLNYYSGDLRIFNKNSANNFAISDMAMIIKGSGNIGIGTTAPEAKIHIAANDFTTSLMDSAGGTWWYGNYDYYRRSRGTLSARTAVQDGDLIVNHNYQGYDGSTWQTGAGFQVKVDGAVTSGIVPMQYYLENRGADGIWRQNLVIRSTGNVGIGTTSPVAKLEVAASSGYSILGGSQKIGNVASPTANSDVATLGWVNSAISSATGSITLWGGTTGGNIWSLNSGNVGIGTSAPTAKLDVNGDFNQGHILTSYSSYVTTGVPEYKTVTLNAVDGTTLDWSAMYRIRVAVSGDTSTQTGATYLVWDSSSYVGDARVWNIRMVNRAGSTSNHVQARLNGNTVEVYHTLNPNSYEIAVFVEKLETNNQSSLSLFGADYTWQRDINSLYYTDGNVGIGTTTPSTKLDVFGSIRLGDGGTNSALTFNSTLNGYLVLGGTANLSVYQNSVYPITSEGAGAVGNTLYLKQGNIGIKTANPRGNLDVTGADAAATTGATANGGLIISGSGTGVINSMGVYSAGTPYAWIQPRYATSATYYNLILNPNGGNVGITTATPTAELEMGLGAGYSILAGSQKVGNIALPTIASDAATKGYVDSSIGSGINGSTNYIPKFTGANSIGDSVIRQQTSGGTGVDVGAYVSLGFSGSNYGSVGYNLAFLATSSQFNYRHTDTASKLEFASGGFQFETAPSGTGGTAISFSRALTILQNGNIGIGTPSPSSKLEVSSVTGTVDSGSGLEITGTGTGAQSWYITPTASQTLLIGRPALRLIAIGNDGSLGGGGLGSDAAASTDAAYYFNGSAGNSWINAGNVGIGTTGPGKLLELSSTSAPSLRIRNTNYTPNRTFDIVAQDSGGLYIVDKDSHYLMNINDTTNGIIIGTSYATGAYSPPSDGLLVQGNVGIGTTSPVAKLEVAALSGYSILAGSQKIGNVALPTAVSDAATKGYVDSSFAPGGSNSLWNGTSTGNIWNMNSANVGIGTTNPTDKLYVSYAGTNYEMAATFRNTATTGSVYNGLKFIQGSTESFHLLTTNGATYLRGIANIPMIFYTNNAEQVRISETGNVGIGTTNPVTKLHVASTTSFNILIANDGGSAVGSYAGVYFKPSGTYSAAGAGGITFEQRETSGNYKTRMNFSNYDGGAGTKMVIDGSNIGVGTTSPSYKLDINGTFKASASSSSIILDLNGDVMIGI